MHLIANLCEARVCYSFYFYPHSSPFSFLAYRYFVFEFIFLTYLDSLSSNIVKLYHIFEAVFLLYQQRNQFQEIPRFRCTFLRLFCIAPTRNRYRICHCHLLIINSYYRIKVHLINKQYLGINNYHLYSFFQTTMEYYEKLFLLVKCVLKLYLYLFLF